MQYTFETLYNQKSLAVMAKCLRKTIRKKKSKRSHIFGWLVVVLAVLLSFVSETEIGKSEFSYEKIAQIAETKQYYVFVFSENHAQIYDKSTMSGGTTEEFEHFLCNMTKKAVVKVS